MATNARGRGVSSNPATQARILEAAERVFASVGYHGATVDLVAQAAGISVATFYRHVANIDELLHALAEDYQAHVERHVMALFSAAAGPAGDESRQQAARDYIANYRRYEGVARVWGAETVRDDELRQLAAASARRVENELRRSLARGVGGRDTRLHAAHLVLIGLVERLPYQLAIPFDLPGLAPSDDRLAEVLSAFVGATIAHLATSSA
jgi:AcrR family transcriptional regulator